jgi:hypothetical protein
LDTVCFSFRVCLAANFFASDQAIQELYESQPAEAGDLAASGLTVAEAIDVDRCRG